MQQQRVPERSQAITSPGKSGPTTSTSFGCLRIAIKRLPANRRGHGVKFRVELFVLDELPRESSAPMRRSRGRRKGAGRAENSETIAAADDFNHIGRVAEH